MIRMLISLASQQTQRRLRQTLWIKKTVFCSLKKGSTFSNHVADMYVSYDCVLASYAYMSVCCSVYYYF